MKPVLLASSSTLDGIACLVNAFWLSTSYSVDPETLEIRHSSRAVPVGARIVKRAGRYRFERIQTTS